MTKLTRAARGTVVALVLALVMAAPAAAAEPTRTVTSTGPGVHHLPAGTICDFPITVDLTTQSRFAVTDFSDGREVSQGHVISRTITNDATGATFVGISAYRDAFWYDAASGVYREMANGQFIVTFAPGDVGPDGVVLDHPLALFIVGTGRAVFDATTFATLDISYKGTVTDICAAIS